ncbi:MAG TPA: flagellar hook-associated protein FlgK [Desulfobacterales bacterium]|nr:flagellar hook-associated protein FlgK [Desulfobacterales bacterium]
MPSIASVLNIAKEALLTHQASINVAGHNIANVDDPGYTRQILDLTTPVATPDRAGFFGNGVRSESVVRQYDRFMVKRLMDQNSTINNLQAQQQIMKVVGTTFNEAPGLAVNDLMSQFWAAWQALSNNPELSSARQTVVQKAEILNDKFQSMTADINQVKLNIGENLKSTISAVNSLTKQLANINVKISASETTRQQQNDLRDTRDDLLKKLSGYVDVNYFESANGAYTIMLGDGHSLVNNNESWSLDWSDNKLHWVQTSATGAQTMAVIPSGEALGAKLGGLVGMNNQLVEGNPDNYLGRLNSLANSLIREVNQQHSQGVGMVPFSDRLVSSEAAHDAALLHTTVDVDTAAETIIAGSLQINGRDIGRIDGSSVVYGQAMGKTYNAAVAINNAGAGVIAKMTTQVAGDAVTPMTAADNGQTISFTVNGIAVNYTVDAAGAPDDTDPALLASHLKDAVNQAISDYNDNVGLTPPQTNQPKITIEALVGNGLNGGAVNALVLRNTNKGDESQIVLAGLDQTDPVEAKAGLTDGTYTADAAHNTGALSVFTGSGPISIDGGADDTIMAELGWAGTVHYSDNAVTVPGANSPVSFTVNGHAVSVNLLSADTAAQNAQLIVDAINLVSAKSGVTAKVGNGTNGGILNAVVFSSETSDIRVDNISGAGSGNLGFTKFTKLGVAKADETANDGKLSYTFADNGVANSLMGLDYADTLSTDGKSFKMWLYNKDGSLALAQPVSIPLERAYNLQDVADVINKSIVNAINDPTVTTPWVEATVSDNKLILTPDASHQFAFGGDDSNFLAAIGLNTIFSGHSAGTIGINSTVSDKLNNLAAGTINKYGEIFRGDNSNALLVSNIQRNEEVSFSGGTTDTLDGFYNSLIAEIGLKSKSINTDLTYNKQVNTQLEAIRDSTSGVSLDEEMANLMKFQHAYTAAAKLITVSDEMLQTLLSTVGR